MKSMTKLSYLSFAAISVTAGAAAMSINGCSTTAVSADAGSGSSSSSGGGGSSSSSSSGGGSSSSSGGGSSSSSGGIVDAGSDGYIAPVTCSASVPPPDGGSFVIDNFSTVIATDAGVAYNNAFGQYPGYFGGTYFFPYAPPTVAGPGQPGTDNPANPDAGNFCTTLWSQNSFTATVTPASNTWVFAGNVAGYSGAGLYIQSAPNLCVNAAAYTGVSFTISGTGGPPAASTEAGAADGAAGDASVGGLVIGLKAFEATDQLYTGAPGNNGSCLTNCNAPTFSFPLPSTATTMTVHWTDFTGGTPDPSVGDPAHLSGIEWDLPWPCTGGVPYPVNFTIQNVQFITN